MNNNNNNSYTIGLDNDNLIIKRKKRDNNDDIIYYCKHCIVPKTKKTKRLVYAIKNKHNLSFEIEQISEDQLNFVIYHPLYDDEIYECITKEESNKLKNTQNDKISKALYYVYVLELEQNKYYVGKSIKPFYRTGEHLVSTLFEDSNKTGIFGSSWTKMYKPIRIIETKPAYNEFEEDMYTIKYMKEKGIDNVRGGSFCELNLNKENLSTLEKMIAGSDDKCYFCGQTDHYINECPQKNVRRVTKKQKKVTIKTKDIPKSKIMKYFGAVQLAQNSNIDMEIDNNNNDDEKEYKCHYCEISFKSEIDRKNHENLLCKKSDKVQLVNIIEKRADAILEQNKHLLDKTKKKKN